MTDQTTDPTTASTPPIRLAIAEQFRAKDRVMVDLLNPLGQPTGISVTLAGRYTPEFKAAQAALRGDDTTERLRALLVGSTLDWTGVLDPDGNPVPCTPAAVAALYAVDWVYPQMVTAFGETQRFFEPAKAA